MIFKLFFNPERIYKYKLFLLMILISKITAINSKEILRKLISFGNEITIRIKGKGEHIFIYGDKINTIESICVNNKDIVKPDNNSIVLEDEDNLIKIKFNLSRINSLDKLFQNCVDIVEIDLSNFNSSLKNGMYHIFYNCISLTSINFNNFDTSSIENMEGIFEGCKNLKSLNLSNFNTSKVKKMYRMFSGCSNLISLNLSNFNTSPVENIEEMFSGCNNLTYLNLSNFDFSEIHSTDNLFKDCNNIIILDLTNIVISEYNSLDDIATNFPKLKYLIIKNSCIQNPERCKIFFQNIPKDIIICTYNLNEIITKMELSNKCITNYCGDDWEDIKKNKSNENGGCSLSCDEGSIENNGKCNKIIIDRTIANIDDIYETNTIKENNIPLIEDSYLDFSSTINNLIEGKDLNMTKIILTGDITSLLTNIESQNFFKEEENKKYQISTLSNQYKQNSSIIDLGDCEDSLRSKYDINENEELIIFKIENIFKGFNIPIIEYEIYLRNGTKISLDICKENTISYYLPVSINENEIFKYDPESNFYNDECNKYTTENNTDMTLYDRKNEYNIKNLSLCEINCTFIGYNNSKAECNCLINTGLNRLGVNPTDLINKLESIKSVVNFGIMQCRGIFSSKEDLESNPGFFLLIFILVIFIIIFIIFWVKGYSNLKEEIENEINKMFKNKNNSGKINNIIELKKSKNNNSILNSKQNKIIKKKSKNSRKNRNKKIKDKEYIKDSFKELKPHKINSIENTKKINKKEIILTKNKNVDIETKKKLHETDYELNNALYDDAKRFDKRSGCEYYYSLLYKKQIFIFSFLNFTDYNSGVLKKFIFFLMFALHYSINAFCFTDANMHQIFEDQGNYNIKYQMKFIIISSVLSTFILRIMLYTLVLTDRNIHDIKCQPNLINANKLKKKTLRYIKIKFGIFFVLNLILLVVFWYYLTCWNAVYQNTKIYLIKNTLISFSISLIYPFIINIIPVILRKISLNKGKRECLYKTSKIFQIL